MGRPVSFDFASGGGSTAEFLMGEVEIEPTLMHNVGTRIVLPDTVTLPLVNGKAVHPDMAISPDGPEPAWAYKVTVRSGMTQRAWSEFRGVPTGTTQIAYKDLPKFVTTIPPETTAGMMQNWADTAQDGATRAEDAADRAEAPTDLMNKNLIENPASLTAGALSAAIAGTGAPQARDAHEYVFYAGVIRNDGAGWQLLPEDTNHRPINIDSIDTFGSYIRVNYSGVGANMTVMFLAVPDETLALNGVICGTSVTATYTDIRISQAAPAVSDYVSWNGTNWVSQDGVFTNISLTPGGVLSLDHASIPPASIYSVSLENRSNTHYASVSTVSQPTGQTNLKLDIRRRSQAAADYVYYDAGTSTWKSQRGVLVPGTFDAGVLTLNHGGTILDLQDEYAVSIAPRGGVYRVNVNSTTGNSLKIEFRDHAGALVTTPSADMKVYLSHGGAVDTIAHTPTTDMRFYITHGGGTRPLNPATLTTTQYPFSNIWLFGIMGMD